MRVLILSFIIIALFLGYDTTISYIFSLMHAFSAVAGTFAGNAYKLSDTKYGIPCIILCFIFALIPILFMLTFIDIYKYGFDIDITAFVIGFYLVAIIVTFTTGFYAVL